jgi:hypothetical protein
VPEGLRKLRNAELSNYFHKILLKRMKFTGPVSEEKDET